MNTLVGLCVYIHNGVTDQADSKCQYDSNGVRDTNLEETCCVPRTVTLADASRLETGCTHCLCWGGLGCCLGPSQPSSLHQRRYTGMSPSVQLAR